MGNDFEARKRAKKRGRSEDLAAEGGRKDRKRRSAIRSICRGMCYNHPLLTEEDKTWTEDASDDETQRDRKNAQAIITELNKANEAEQAKAEVSRLKRRDSKQKRKATLSTAVQLTDPELLEAQKRQAGSDAVKRDDLSENMRQFPECMQSFMVEERHCELMPVQERSWPEILAGQDVLATAEPGSGKTLAYILPTLPLLQNLQSTRREESDDPSVLILVPTRELALQVSTVLKAAYKLFGYRSVCIYGGADKAEQIASLGLRPQYVVATPGRLLELTEEDKLSLSNIKYLVLDEADKMLGPSLEPQLTQIRKLVVPSKRRNQSSLLMIERPRPQVILMTATWTKDLEKSCKRWQHEPVRLQVGLSSASISRSVTQVVQVCAEHKKPQKLTRHLQQIQERNKGARNLPKILIFANRVKTVRFLYEIVLKEGFRVVMLHGDRSQPEREEAMLAFRSGKAQIMVATDVAGRGLHIKGLPYVVNYDFPSSIEQYIHRAGRTGRLALHGHCFSFFTRNLAPIAQPIMDLLQEHGQTVDPNLVKLAEAFRVASEKLETHAGNKGQPQDFHAEGDDDSVLADLFGGGTQQEGEDPLPLHSGQVLNDLVEAKAPGKRKAVPGRLRKKFSKQKKLD